MIERRGAGILERYRFANSRFANSHFASSRFTNSHFANRTTVVKFHSHFAKSSLLFLVILTIQSVRQSFSQSISFFFHTLLLSYFKNSILFAQLVPSLLQAPICGPCQNGRLTAVVRPVLITMMRTNQPRTTPGRIDQSGETGQTVQRFHNGQGVGKIKELAKRDPPPSPRTPYNVTNHVKDVLGGVRERGGDGGRGVQACDQGLDSAAE